MPELRRVLEISETNGDAKANDAGEGVPEISSLSDNQELLLRSGSYPCMS